MRWLTSMLCLCCSAALALCPPLSPEPVRLTIKHQQQHVLAQLKATETDLGMQQLQLRVAERSTPLASLELAAANGPFRIRAQPLVEDSNLDGVADHIWFISTDGKLWRAALAGTQIAMPVLMADLAESGLDFIATAGLLRTRMPSTLAPLAWRHADQHAVLLIGRDHITGQDSLLLLRFTLNTVKGAITYFPQLADRTQLTEQEQSQVLSANDWRQLLAKAGWHIRLPGKISAAPTVVAGVIYAAVTTTSQAEACSSTDNSQLLYALHLHTASSVYAKRSKAVPYLADASLVLQQQANKQLKLILRNAQEQIVVQPNLLKISADCHNCTEPLSLDKFPLWKRLATYRNERGAY